MKRLLILVLLMLSFTAHAGMQIQDAQPTTFSGYNGQPSGITGVLSSGSFGSLFVDTPGIFTATHLGSESSHNNGFFLGNGLGMGESRYVGGSVSMQVDSPGLLDFGFYDGVQSSTNFVIMPGQTNSIGTFDYILGFNDLHIGDVDYDDYVVGVNFVSVVPEPETYAMLLAGLALVGFTARRR